MMARIFVVHKPLGGPENSWHRFVCSLSFLRRKILYLLLFIPARGAL